MVREMIKEFEAAVGRPIVPTAKELLEKFRSKIIRFRSSLSEDM